MKTQLIGNGDIQSLNSAIDRVKFFTPDGVMIGRASIGNPWILSEGGVPLLPQARLKVAIEHFDLYRKYFPEIEKAPYVFNKFLYGYFKGIPNKQMWVERFWNTLGVS